MAVRKLAELDRLLVSKSGQAAGRLKSIAFGLTGAYLIAMTAWRYFALGISSGAQYSLLVGALSFFVIRYQKRIYISPAGMVKETRTWLTSHRDILGWDEIKFVTVMYKGNQAMAFIERDTLGWKALFDRDQIPRLKELFGEYIPDVEIDEITRSD